MSVNFALTLSRKGLLVALLVVIATVLFFSLVAAVSTLTLSQVDGNWTALRSSIPAVIECNRVIEPIVPTGEKRIVYGIPDGRNICPAPEEYELQSGLGFIGSNLDLDIQPGKPFPLAIFTHYNRPISGNQTTLITADLDIDLTFVDPMEVAKLQFEVGVEETLNSPDKVSFPKTIPDQSFLGDDRRTQYTLQMAGFISSSTALNPNDCIYEPSAIQDEYITQEQQENRACLFARIIVITPTVSVSLSADLESAVIGDVINYSITLVNVGNAVMKDVTVTDTVLDIVNQNLGDMDIGDIRVVNGSYGPVTENDLRGPLVNITIATAKTLEGNEFTFMDSYSVPLAALTLAKTAYFGHNGGASCPGSDFIYASSGSPVTYCFAITNTGSATLTNVTVVDSALGIQLSQPGPLKEPVILHSEATASRDPLNTAQASATVIDATGAPIQGATSPTDTDSAEVKLVFVEAVAVGQEPLNVGSTKKIIATAAVTESNNSIPVPNLTVSFAVTRSNIFTDAQRTDRSGQVTFTYTGTNNIVNATDKITVWVDLDENQVLNGVEPRAVLTVTWLPISVTVRGAVAGTEQVATRTMTVTIENSQRQRVDQLNVKIGFNVSGGTSVITDPVPFSGGQVVFKYTSIAPPTSAAQTTASNLAPAEQRQPNATQVCDVITIWVDLEPNHVFDEKLPLNGLAEPHYQECVVTAIDLLYFTAQPHEDRTVHLSWQTAAEIDNAGFNIHRSSFRDGPYVKINNKLLAAKGDAMGAQYEYIDESPGALPVYYKLEDVDYSGVSTFHGPVRAPSESVPDDGAMNSKLYLPLITR